MKRVWQLPVKRDKTASFAWVHGGAKYHAFKYGRSLCGKYINNVGCYDTRVSEKEILECPDMACKRCLTKAGLN